MATGAAEVFTVEMLNDFIERAILIPLPIQVKSFDYHDRLSIKEHPRYIPVLNRPYNGPMDYWLYRGALPYSGPYCDRERAETALYHQQINEILDHRFYVEGIR